MILFKGYLANVVFVALDGIGVLPVFRWANEGLT